MPRPAPQLHLPQPCSESWEAMTPVGAGRHCAACEQVVIDFTQKTDAELLTYFRRAAAGPILCGRFRADQLGRPLGPPPTASLAKRGRAWLALLLAAWGIGRAEAAPGPVPHPTHHAPPRATPKRPPDTLAIKYVRGTVRDSVSGVPLAGVAVFLRGENRMATTDSLGRFRLRLAPRRPRGGRTLVLHFAGYQSATVRLPATARPGPGLALALRPDPAADGVAVVGYQVATRREVTGGAPVLLLAAPETLPQKVKNWVRRLPSRWRRAQP